MLTLGKCLALALLGNWQALQSFGREFKCLVVFFFLFLSFSIEFLFFFFFNFYSFISHVFPILNPPPSSLPIPSIEFLNLSGVFLCL